MNEADLLVHFRQRGGRLQATTGRRNSSIGSVRETPGVGSRILVVFGMPQKSSEKMSLNGDRSWDADAQIEAYSSARIIRGSTLSWMT